MFPYSAVFTFVFKLNCFRHLSSLKLYKVTLQDESPDVTVEGEFILFEYSLFCKVEAQLEIPKQRPAHPMQHSYFLWCFSAEELLALRA